MTTLLRHLLGDEEAVDPFPRKPRKSGVEVRYCPRGRDFDRAPPETGRVLGQFYGGAPSINKVAKHFGIGKKVMKQLQSLLFNVHG